MRYLHFSKAPVMCLEGKTSGAQKFSLHSLTFTGIAVLPTPLLAFTHELFPSFLPSAHHWVAKDLAAHFSYEVTAQWQKPRRLRKAPLFFWSLLLADSPLWAHLAIPGDPGKRGLHRQRSPPQAIHTCKIIFLFSHWCLCYAMTCISSSFHFLSTFWPCLFVYLSFDFFFSWFHWWIWSIPSLPCQWKTHQPFVQADIPVSITSCAKRLCAPQTLMAQRVPQVWVLPSLQVDFSSRLFRHGRCDEVDSRRGETASAHSQVARVKLVLLYLIYGCGVWQEAVGPAIAHYCKHTAGYLFFEENKERLCNSEWCPSR